MKHQRNSSDYWQNQIKLNNEIKQQKRKNKFQTLLEAGKDAISSLILKEKRSSVKVASEPSKDLEQGQVKGPAVKNFIQHNINQVKSGRNDLAISPKNIDFGDDVIASEIVLIRDSLVPLKR